MIPSGGIQSNHCWATSVAAKYLNLDWYLILRTSEILIDKDPGLMGNLLVECLIGAHIKLAVLKHKEVDSQKLVTIQDAMLHCCIGYAIRI